MGDILSRGVRVLGPRALTLRNGQVGSGVIRVDVTDSPARFAIPSAFAGKFCKVYTEGDIEADMLFGASSVSCTYGQKSSVNSETITIHSASGGHVTSQPRDMMFPVAKLATHFSCDASGAGQLVIELAE